jgi:hypothetical protein
MLCCITLNLYQPLFVNKSQAKMNKMDDFETSLQVLRGFETDITSEVNDIKARTCIFFWTD